MRSSLLFFVTACWIGACASPPPPAAELDGTVWTLAELPDRDLLAGTSVTLRFEGGRAGGSDGCNSYGTTYREDGSWLELGEIAATQMACDPLVMDQAAAYLAALGAARTAHRSGERLVLRDAQGADLAELTLQSQGLAGTAWTVTGYNNGKDAVVSVLAGTELTLVFEASGKATGSAGCNRFFGAYVSSGPELAIASVGATRKMCGEPDGVMAQEGAFLAALPLAAEARVDGNRLELRSAAGALVLTATRSRGP